MSLRAKLILNSALLVLALLCALLAAREMVGAFTAFQQQEALAKAGDVRTIRSWMTIPYIAHQYHVPERYLYGKINVAEEYPTHSTLHAIALRYHRSLDQLIHQLQAAITDYRKQHPPHPPKVPTHVPIPRPMHDPEQQSTSGGKAD